MPACVTRPRQTVRFITLQLSETYEGDWELWLLRLMEILETGATLHYLPQRAALVLLRKVSTRPIRRDKWLLDVAKERLFVLLKQHIERGDTGELLEQTLLCLGALTHTGVATRAVEACAFIIKRCACCVAHHAMLLTRPHAINGRAGRTTSASHWLWLHGRHWSRWATRSPTP